MKFEVNIEVHNEKQNSQAKEMVEEFCRELPSRMSLKSCTFKAVKKKPAAPKKVEKKHGE